MGRKITFYDAKGQQSGFIGNSVGCIMSVSSKYIIVIYKGTLFQVRPSVIVIPCLTRCHPELDSGPVVFCHVDNQGCFYLVLNRVQDDGSSLELKIAERQ